MSSLFHKTMHQRENDFNLVSSEQMLRCKKKFNRPLPKVKRVGHKSPTAEHLLLEVMSLTHKCQSGIHFSSKTGSSLLLDPCPRSLVCTCALAPQRLSHQRSLWVINLLPSLSDGPLLLLLRGVFVLLCSKLISLLDVFSSCCVDPFILFTFVPF